MRIGVGTALVAELAERGLAAPPRICIAVVTFDKLFAQSSPEPYVAA